MKPNRTLAFSDVNFTIRAVWDIEVNVMDDDQWDAFVRTTLSRDQCLAIFKQSYPNYKKDGWEVYSHGFGNRSCGGAKGKGVETEVDIIYSVRIPAGAESTTPSP